jgi:hypothetical protein
MLVVLRGLALACVVVSLSQTVSASDALYRCQDGTFTNRVERQCAPYEAKGIVRVQGRTAEASKQRSDEVKLDMPKYIVSQPATTRFLHNSRQRTMFGDS